MRNLRSIVRGAAIALLAMQASLFGTWQQPPTVISNPPTYSLNFFAGPVLKVAPNGNAITVWLTPDDSPPLSETSIQSAYYAQGFGWLPSETISSLELNSADKPLYTSQADPSIALRSDGYAVAVWDAEHSDLIGIDSQTIIATRRVNGNWQPVEIIGDDSGNFISTDVQVSMNEAGTSLAIWRADAKNGTTFTAVSFLPFGGAWTTPYLFPVEVSTNQTHPYAFINPNGDAVAVWFGILNDPTPTAHIFAATYKATTDTWSSPVILDSHSGNFGLQKHPRCGMDAAGHAVAGWLADAADNLSASAKAAWFNGTAWEPTITVGPSDFNSDLSACDVVIDLNGNATAVWVGPFPEYDMFASSRLSNDTWTAPQVISTPGDGNSFTFTHQEPLSVNPEGDVIAIWSATDEEIIKTAFKPFEKDWRAPETVAASNDAQGYYNVGIASCGFAIAVWQRFPEEGAYLALASINENLLLPEDTLIAQCCQKLPSGRRCVNILTWAEDPCVLFYNIYCNGVLLANVFNTGAALSFIDANVCRECSYTISTVNVYGFEGEQVPFTFL